MALINWVIVALYIFVIIIISLLAGRSQNTQEDYFLGGRRMSHWLVGSSLLANQVSAISLVSAPAFIAVRKGGGLKWLQYELAVPLAMLFIMLFLVPVFRKRAGITIYGFLEDRLGRAARMAVSLLFMLNRSIGAGVILLATSYVSSALLALDLNATILLIGLISMAYTSIGGIKADIYTDVIQLIVLWISCIACVYILAGHVGTAGLAAAAGSGRMGIFQFGSAGVGDGNTFAFWPMLIGGFFLYVSYYGCDQSQAQRLLATPDMKGSWKALLMNGILRFPLVVTYCAVGVLMIPFIAQHPGFAASLKGHPPDYLMPHFFMSYVPDGLLGLIITGILAASMSSLDSAINSLSAITWEDFLKRAFPGVEKISDYGKVRLSRLITLCWGIVAIGFALAVAGSSETIIEVVNKTGSALYGPVAGIFVLAIFFRRAKGGPALIGLAAGVAVNIGLWLFFEYRVSWMWWNLTGFAMTVAIGSAAGSAAPAGTARIIIPAGAERKTALRYAAALIAWFAVIVLACLAIEGALR